MAGELGEFEAFGEVLRRLRVRAGLTQDELAENSGVSERTIRRLETGNRTNPRMTTVQELARALPLRPEEREQLFRAAVPGNLDGGQQGDQRGDQQSPQPGDQQEGAKEEPGASSTAVTDADADADADANLDAAPHPDGTPTPNAEPAAGPIPEPPYAPPTEPASTPPDPAEQLAKQVAARWQREEEQRQVQDPFPLPVRWRTASEAVTDHWANILRLPARATADPLDLDGQLDEISDTYRRIPSGRLVVLGRSGSGKTILALRFVLDHLKSRTPTEPVPVIFSIGAWNPTALTLRDWLTAQLTRDHPGYAARGPGRESLASALVESGRILPVLDGFDEMADGLRRPALEALNATTLPLLLTSRPAEYAAAVAETDVLTAAAAIELTDLTLDDLADYLPRTTRKTDRADPAANAWKPVLTELAKRPHHQPHQQPNEPHQHPNQPHQQPHQQPESDPTSPLAEVLATPLMVALARTIYSDTPDHDPASLLDTERFGTPEELEDHLLDNFIPTVYRHRLHRSPTGKPPPDFGAERARHWLGYLAHHLTRLETPDLAWWRLGNGLSRSTRTLVTALVTGLVIGLVDGAAGLAIGGMLLGSIVDASAVGLLAGLMLGLVHWLTYSVKGKHVTPSAVRLQIRGRPESTAWRAGPRLLIGTLGGGFFGFAYGFVAGVVKAYAWQAALPTCLRIGLVDGLVFGVVFSAGAGLTFCLLGVLESPLDLDSVVSPRSLLNTNRATVTTQLLVWAPTFGAVVGFGSGAAIDLLQGPLGPLVWSSDASLVLGIISGLGGALGYALTLTAWGQWLVLTRIWLPLTGRLPWAVITFLEDAYQRGVLRQAGAVYQFRHARLQHHLARRHRDRHR